MVLWTADVKVGRSIVWRDLWTADGWVVMSAAWKVVKLVYSTVAKSVAAKASIKAGRTAELLADEKGVKTVD